MCPEASYDHACYLHSLGYFFCVSLSNNAEFRTRHVSIVVVASSCRFSYHRDCLEWLIGSIEWLTE